MFFLVDPAKTLPDVPRMPESLSRCLQITCIFSGERPTLCQRGRNDLQLWHLLV
jgi:hypothetical protein